MRKILAWFLLVALVASASSCKSTELPLGCRPGELSELMKENKPSAQGDSIRLEPALMRKLLFEGHTSVLLGLNRLHQAKSQVSVARANLLPSLNLGALLYTAGNPTFILSSVEFLLPFLVPSKWLEARRIKKLFEAEKIAFRLLELNEFASAYSLYMAALSDLALEAIYLEEIEDLSAIEESVRRAEEVGLASSDTVERAKGQLAMARVNASRISDLVRQEAAAMRHALGLPARMRIDYVAGEPAPSAWEDATVAQVTAQALRISPELRQMGILVSAAGTEKWSTLFGFLGGFSLGNRRGMTGSEAFNGLQGSGGANLGFAMFPQYKLSKQNVVEFRIREREVRLEAQEVVESSLGSVREGKERLALAQGAEDSFRKVYQAKLGQFELGISGIIPALMARAQLRQASIEVLRARTQLALSRIALHRILLTGEFASIQGCQAK